ncbi:hypothetical protein PROFUN_05839 [Planoprotostelium fungivorum]|uniref:Major facilitator superfamily (MFS) profile domain-containing protein n=1 Tax=Planoprotostelium fungivorum TaxID=1890364 RepID=A0A2P6NKL8_9EUKA|nr:hypothetical protein PROFUN_05839 [Planoprotostelium fungivorum]
MSLAVVVRLTHAANTVFQWKARDSYFPHGETKSGRAQAEMRPSSNAQVNGWVEMKDQQGSVPPITEDHTLVWKPWRLYRTNYDKIRSHHYDGLGTFQEPFIVDWMPEDPEHPIKFPKWYKWVITFIVAISTFVVAFCSSAYSGGTREIMITFRATLIQFILGVSLFVLGFALGPLLWAPLSEIFGRRIIFIITYTGLTAFNGGAVGAQDLKTLLILRFLAGAAGSSPLTNGGGTLSDIFEAKDRGIASCMFATAPFMGPALGPIVGGFVGQYCGFRWIEGIMTILSGAVLIMGLVFLPETYSPVLLQERAKLLSMRTGMRYISRYDADKPTSRKEVFISAISRPWVLLLTEPLVFLLSVYMAVIYGILYMLFAAYPIVFQQQRGWTPGIGGLPFLGILVGMLGAIAYSYYEYVRYLKLLAKNGGTVSPEERLPPAIIGAVLLPIGLFWFAWTTDRSIHWMSPVAAGVPFGMGMVLVFLSVLIYLIDSYTEYAARWDMSEVIIQLYQCSGGQYALFTNDMYKSLGIHWASSVPAFLSLVCIPAPIIFYLYGGKIRMMSKYASRVERIDVQLQKAYSIDLHLIYVRGPRTSCITILEKAALKEVT